LQCNVTSSKGVLTAKGTILQGIIGLKKVTSRNKACSDDFLINKVIMTHYYCARTHIEFEETGSTAIFIRQNMSSRVHVRRYLLTSAGKLCLRQKLWLYELIRPLASAEHICWRARLMLVQLLVWKICGALPIALCNNILLGQTSKLQICVQSALLLRHSSWHLAHCCRSQGQVYSGEYCQAGHMGCILL
jgi:hypothetical protein